MSEGYFLLFLLVLFPLYVLWPAIWESRGVTKLRFFYYPRGIAKSDFTAGKFNPYYSRLAQEERAIFAWRTFYFLDTTDVKFRHFENQSPALFEKTKLLLATIAAQMTLFLPEDCFKMIHTIIVYPEPFRSRGIHEFHKGETNPGAGVIVLSLTGIEEGIREPYDGVNLILHEYAHALWLEHKLTSYEVFDNEAADHFESLAKRELERSQKEGNGFFREYGLTNLIEFVAVSTENFFERPWKFKETHGDLYASMTALYKQDPSRLMVKPD